MTLEPFSLNARSSEFRDRRAWLVRFGLLQIVVGLVWLALALLFVMAAMAGVTVMSPFHVDSIRFVLSSVAFAAFGAGFVAVGFLSVYAKPAVRLWALVLGYVWLAFGVVATSSLARPLFFPPRRPWGFQRHYEMQQSLTEVWVFLAVAFLIVLPATFLKFYGSENVRVTCERVADGRLKLLPNLLTALAILLLCWALYDAVGMATRPPILFFQTMHDAIAKPVLLISGILSAYSFWLLCECNLRGWWIALGTQLFWTTSGIVNVAMMAYYLLIGPVLGIEDRYYNALEGSKEAMLAALVLHCIFLGLLLRAKVHFATATDSSMR